MMFNAKMFRLSRSCRYGSRDFSGSLVNSTKILLTPVCSNCARLFHKQSLISPTLANSVMSQVNLAPLNPTLFHTFPFNSNKSSFSSSISDYDSSTTNNTINASNFNILPLYYWPTTLTSTATPAQNYISILAS